MTEEKKVWGVRSGRQQEFESYCLEHGCVVIGWEVGDLSTFGDKESLREAIKRVETNSYRIGKITGQCWSFAHEIQPGNMVLMPRGRIIAVGEIIGDYAYDGSAEHGIRHRRRVEWREKELSRGDLHGDLRNNLQALQTVFRVGRPQAEVRIAAAISGDVEVVSPQILEVAAESEDSSIEFSPAGTAREQIRDHIIQNFHGYAMQDLVAGILEAQGFTCRVSPPGPDRGVDILAGKGDMGFGSPRLCVQVKSGSEKVGRPLVDALAGVIENFHAEQGLFVSWSGFRFSKGGGHDHFKIRFWDAEDLIDMIERHYDQLPDDIKRQLPLKRIWVLAGDDSDD